MFQCRQKLTTKQKVESDDYKVRKLLVPFTKFTIDVRVSINLSKQNDSIGTANTIIIMIKNITNSFV